SRFCVGTPFAYLFGALLHRPTLQGGTMAAKTKMRYLLRKTRGLGIPLPLRAEFIKAALRSDYERMRALGAVIEDEPYFYCETCGCDIWITRYVLSGSSGEIVFEFGHVGPEMYISTYH